MIKPFQQRVIDEKDELGKKLSALNSFRRTEVFINLPEEEKKRLERQQIAMSTYFDVLFERIGAFNIQD